MSFAVRGAVIVSAADYPTTAVPSEGTTVGDLLIRICNTTGSFSTPSGWTLATSGGGGFGHGYDVFWKIADSGDVSGISVGSDATNYEIFIALAGYVTAPSDWGASDTDTDALPFLGAGDSHYVTSSGSGTVTSALTFDARPGMLAIYFAGTALDAADTTVTIDRGDNSLNAGLFDGYRVVVVNHETLTAAESVTVTLSFPSTDSGDTAFFGYVLLPLADTGADNFADATVVTLPTDDDVYLSPLISNRALTTESGEIMHDDGDGDILGSRSAWWSYTPGNDGTVTIDTHLTIGYGYTALFLTTGTAVNALTVVAYDDNDTVGASITHAVVGGTTYHIKVGSWVDDPPDPTNDSYYVLRLSGPSTDASSMTVAAPPIIATGEVIAYDPLPDNDNFADTKHVIIATDAGTYTSGAGSDAARTTETGEPVLYLTQTIHRTAWWTYRPRTTGTVDVDLGSSTGTETIDLHLRAYRVHPDNDTLTALTLIADGDAALAIDSIARVSFRAQAGGVYHLQTGINSSSDDPVSVVLTATGPAAGVTSPMTVTAPPITATAAPAAPGIARLTLISANPTPGTTVPVTRPVFTATVKRGEAEAITVTVHAEVTTVGDVSFLSPIATYETSILLSTGLTTATLPATTTYTAGTYNWRIRYHYAGINSSWYTFTWTGLGGYPYANLIVPSSLAAANIPITWTVASSGAVVAPHLWYVTPDAGKAGDHVTAVGQGFPSSGSVTVGGVSATVVSWTHVTGTGSALSQTDRDEVVFVVPNVAAPGGPVQITE